MNRSVSYAILWMGIALGIGLGVLLTWPPPIPTALSLKQFSIENEKNHIQALSQNPHPLGTAEHTKVREYILNELRALELKPEVQIAQNIDSGGSGYARISRVQNLMTRMPGRDSSGAILLMAHYDSVPDAPGANDDSAGVAAILEILRILTVSEPLRNDIIALITDGEEIGMVGAQVFFEQHPWAEDVKVVLNFEARGSRGVSYMYETGPDNAWLIRAFARSVTYPIGNSITHAIYQKMPNDSDFTLAKNAGIAGLNFAYIDGWQAYHTPLDNSEHLNDATLYHHGSTVLELATFLAEEPLNSPPPGDAVYFNLWRPWLISYPVGWIWPLTGAALALFVLTLAVGLGKQRITWSGILLGALTLALSAGAAVGLTALLKYIVRSAFGAAFPTLALYPDFRDIYLVAFLCFTILVFILFFGLARKWAEAPSLAAGTLVWWALGAAALAHFMPQVSFLFTWPLIFATLSLWVIQSLHDPDEISPAHIILLILLALPAFIQLSMLFTAFNSAFVVMPVSVLILILMLGLLTPALAVYTPKAFWGTSIIFLVLAVGTSAFGLYGLNAEARPRSQQVVYQVDQNQTYLGIQERSEWAAGFMEGAEEVIPTASPAIRGPLLRKSIAGPAFAPPEITVTSSSHSANLLTALIAIRSVRRAPALEFWLASENPFSLRMEPDSGKLFSSVRTEKETDAGKPHRLRVFCYAPPDEGLEFWLETPSGGTIDIDCGDLSYDLPPGLIPDRPDSILLQPRTVVYTRTQIKNPVAR